MHSQAILIVVTRVRRPPIGMMQQPGLGTAAIERHRERGEGQMAIIHRADRPTDDAAGEQIQDRCDFG